jgi:hypothetical protein
MVLRPFSGTSKPMQITQQKVRDKMPEQTQTQTYVGFDDISMPLNKALVTIDNTDPDCPIVGAGLCWDKIEGRHAVTVELAMRGMEPMHFSLVENDEGAYEVMLPDFTIHAS